MSVADASAGARPKLGRLKSFGMKGVEDVPLLLPKGYDDLRSVCDEFDWLVDGDRVSVSGILDAEPVTNWSGTPRMTSYLRDAGGSRVGFTFFGDSRKLREQMPKVGGRLILLGLVKDFGGKKWLSAPEIVEPGWVGRVRPRYPALPRVIGEETVRLRMAELLPGGIPASAAAVSGRLSENAKVKRVVGAYLRQWGMSGDEVAAGIAELLQEAHEPVSPESGFEAQERLERIASLGIWAGMESARSVRGNASHARVSELQGRVAALPFGLSESQYEAVRAAMVDIRSGVAMRRLLNGDVGTGKSAVIGLVVCAVADSGGRCFVIVPSQTLAEQLHGDFLSWWPDLADKTHLAVGGRERRVGKRCRIVVGTTALLHGDYGRADLVAIDEQHRFARHQREQLVDSGCHLLESTATCIPRTYALAKYGALDVSVLRNRVAQRIKTKIRRAEDRESLWQDVLKTLEDGGQVLVIYPTRTEDAQKDDLPSAEAAAERWGKRLPGQVGLAHAGRSDEENRQVLDAMKSGALRVLVSTVLVEVGINIPGLRRCAVFHAERFGLSQLHQIRGRVARQGGEGYFDLVVPREVSDKTLERLSVLERVNDGFEIGKEDMRLRGFGDLKRAGDRQHGSDDTFLFGRGVRPELMEEILERMSAC